MLVLPRRGFSGRVSYEGAAVRGRSVRRPARPSEARGRDGPLAQDQEEMTMTEYLITFNDEWVQEHTEDEIKAKGVAARAVVREMQEQGVLIFTNGGLDRRHRDLQCRGGGRQARLHRRPLRRDEGAPRRLLRVVDVPDDEAARYWAGTARRGLDWPQEVHRFRGAGMARRDAAGRRERHGEIPAVRLRTGRAHRVRRLSLPGGHARGVRRHRRVQRHAPEGRALRLRRRPRAGRDRHDRRRQGERPVFTDGPYLETKEHLGGFWVIEAADLDVALALAAEGSKACRGTVEVRPFQTAESVRP